MSELAMAGLDAYGRSASGAWQWLGATSTMGIAPLAMALFIASQLDLERIRTLSDIFATLATHRRLGNRQSSDPCGRYQRQWQNPQSVRGASIAAEGRQQSRRQDSTGTAWPLARP